MAEQGGGRVEKPGRPGGRSPLSSPVSWLVLIVLAIFVFRAFQDVGVRRVDYSEWKELLAKGSFTRVVVGQDHVRGYPKPEVAAAQPTEGAGSAKEIPFVANRPSGDAALLPAIEAAKVPYDAAAPSAFSDLVWIWLMPMGLVLLFWSFMMRRMTGGMGQGPQSVMSFGKTQGAGPRSPTPA